MCVDVFRTTKAAEERLGQMLRYAQLTAIRSPQIYGAKESPTVQADVESLRYWAPAGVYIPSLK